LTLTADVEALVLQGAGNISGTGNTLANNLFGNAGNNTLDGGGGANQLTGNAGNDFFVFRAGQANGDTVIDFAGNGAGGGRQFAVRRLWHERRDLHASRGQPVADSFRPRRSQRVHHAQQRRHDPSERLQFCMNTTKPTELNPAKRVKADP
jgi:hypothetical protein